MPISDPWSNSAGASALVSLPPVPSKMTPTRTGNGFASSFNSPNNQTTNPWSNKPNSISDPWATSTTNTPSKVDDFDLFTNNRVVTNTAAPAADPFGDFFGEITNSSKTSTNPWDSSGDKQRANDPFEGIAIAPKPAVPNTVINPTRKTPESFLGENSSLVNLDNLIPARSKSTNPFGSAIQPHSNTLSTSNSIGSLNNPFMNQQKPVPTISQLQSQQSTFPFATPPINGMTPSLPQPLINPPMQPFSMPFNNTNQPFLQQNQPPLLPAFNQNNNFFNPNQNSSNNSNTNPSTNPFLMM